MCAFAPDACFDIKAKLGPLEAILRQTPCPVRRATILPCAFVTTTLPLSSHRAGNATIRDAGVSLPTRVLVPPIPFAQDAVRETVPSVIEPVICFALGPSPCQVPSIKAKLVFTEVCDVIVRVWSGALLDDLR